MRRLTEAESRRGFALRKRQREGESSAWHETVTKHLPESWPAARLALQARIAALDIQ
ncbi:hypothetical protein [Methyloceanibacter sp.]|uniref:hypothetical protein n=1 Tax=Methyloceanibacter sp. TaxID=1965321 RepID=UPI002D45F75E|nr:hypothetical protein [Methyloceanibacter sp.]HZP09159.1 hypothetical protein [Methyloceanibacter sp.]